MKKILVASLLAALAISATACGESDKCETPMALTMISTISSTVTQKVDTENLTDAAKAVTECTEFSKQMASVAEKYKDTKTEDLKADWEALKDSTGTCKLFQGLTGALTGLEFAGKYADMEAATKYCTGAALEGVKEASVGLGDSMTTIGGWHDILQSAADATDPNKK